MLASCNTAWLLLLLLAQMASALQHIHDLGYAHLDLKPENIFRATNSNNTYKLGDFGLATQRDGSRGGAEGDARCGWEGGKGRISF